MSQHQIHYEVLNSRNTKENERHWAIEVHATQRELQAFDESGYLVREKLFQGHDLKRLRTALDQLEEREQETRDNAVSNKRGWGFIPRHLMDKEPVFLELLKFQPGVGKHTNFPLLGLSPLRFPPWYLFSNKPFYT